MGNLIFPSPSPPGYGMSWPIKKTPLYKTIVRSPLSGRGEVRIALQQWPRWKFEVNLGYLRGDLQSANSWLQQIVGFYGAVLGRADDWLYSDPYDYLVAGAAFGTGDGSTTTFQLQRTLPSGMLDIVQNVGGTPTIYVAGAAVTPSSISPTGLVTFSTAPASGAALTWTGQFYFRCRFADDSLSSLQEDLYQIWSLSGLAFESVIL